MSLPRSASLILRIFEQSDEERIEKGKKAKRFVLEEKSNVCQAKKIMGLIGNCK